MPLQQFIDAWNLFFHAEVSCATLLIFRIAIEFLLLANGLLLIPLIDDYFSEDGVWPTGAWLRQTCGSRFCLLTMLPPATNSFGLLLLVHFVASVGFLLGFHFRLCACLIVAEQYCRRIPDAGVNSPSQRLHPVERRYSTAIAAVPEMLQ